VDPTSPRLGSASRVTARQVLLLTWIKALILHLGMSGSLRVLPADAPPDARSYRPRWSGRSCASTIRGAGSYYRRRRRQHRLLRHLAPSRSSRLIRLPAASRAVDARRMVAADDARLVTGIGNIYASEALFRARIAPNAAART
jgi:formamidopyrimidine-DNA glycosylase